MEKIKKVLAIVLSLTIALTMGSVAFVFGDITTTGKIKAPNNQRTYEVYQVVVGNVSHNSGVVTDAFWGRNGSEYQEGESTEVPQTTLDALAALNSESSNITKYAEISKYVNLNNPIGTVKNGSVLEVTTGYYVIKDIGSVGPGESYSYYITTVVGGNTITITPKDSGVSSYKKVQDDETPGWVDSADYDIGEKFKFQLVAQLPSDIVNYSVFPLTFHDKHSAGFDFDISSVKVYLDKVEVDADLYSVLRKGNDGEEGDGLTGDGCDFGVHFNNVKAIPNAKAGSQLSVEYFASLNEQANIGAVGNDNTSHVTYDNNPQDDKIEEKGKTPDDLVKVFTYEMQFTKYANSVAPENKLAGAVFSLTDKNDPTKTYEIKVDSAGSKFTVKGLDAGTYILKETKKPSEEYNTMDDLEITITAVHLLEAATPELTGLSVNANFRANKELGLVEGDIINVTGSTLPTTGGIGTVLFYMFGGIMVAAAAILLITKKRVQAK